MSSSIIYTRIRKTSKINRFTNFLKKGVTQNTLEIETNCKKISLMKIVIINFGSILITAYQYTKNAFIETKIMLLMFQKIIEYQNVCKVIIALVFRNP